MKSLNDNYVSGGSSHETFSDLMFCALIVLVLFIMALAIEVSTRVKADLVPPVAEVVPEVNEEALSTMTKEEVAELSEKLQKQEQEMNVLREKIEDSAAAMASQKNHVSNQLAAMQGEQRFTGAREPATLAMAYDYDDRRYYFISSRESNHAQDRRSGETSSEFSLRQTKELVAIALKARKQRGYTQAEATKIYQAFSTYKEVEPSLRSYKIVDSVVGINYITALSGYIAGDTTVGDIKERLVVAKLLAIYAERGEKSDRMYPSVVLKVNLKKRKIDFNGVLLSPQDAKEILLSLSGRGAMIDLEGLEGKPPSWLTEKVLIPAGYISKTPKLPEE